MDVSRTVYILQPAPRTACPRCGNPMLLLCPESGENNVPWFYVCQTDSYVGQVGVGPVRREGDTED